MSQLQISIIIWDTRRTDGPDGPPSPLDVRVYRSHPHPNGVLPSDAIAHQVPVAPMSSGRSRRSNPSPSVPRPLASSDSRRSTITSARGSHRGRNGASQTHSTQMALRPPSRQASVLGSAHHSIPRPHPHFQYSKCSGRKKAVGINYPGQKGELRGCVNDAKNVHAALVRHFGYKERDIVVLVDDSRNPRLLPTRRNMISAMNWLIKNANPNDSLFFHYSGHGGQKKDVDGDEIDGQDEVIFPLDFEKCGTITDDELNHILVKPLPAGCRLTALFDSCHSGSVLDLPYLYHTDGRVKGNTMNSGARPSKATSSDVVLWSGCKDSQTSADTRVEGRATGAMSYAFLAALSQNPHQSYQQLLTSVRDILRKKYSQNPQLSSSHPIDTNLQFIV